MIPKPIQLKARPVTPALGPPPADVLKEKQTPEPFRRRPLGLAITMKPAKAPIKPRKTPGVKNK